MRVGGSYVSMRRRQLWLRVGMGRQVCKRAIIWRQELNCVGGKYVSAQLCKVAGM